MSSFSIPKKYVPPSLSRKDTKKQKRNIIKSRKLYQKGIYFQRPKVKSFHSKPSGHVYNAEKMYGVSRILPNNELARKTKCSKAALEKIVNKGRGAYYSSGSRPNQTAESWGRGRLASVITGGPASVIDYGILYNGCDKSSKALKLATKTCKKKKRCQKYTLRV
uniref:DUF5824 domain-containing protein n=1 Tax=viral metagenome TaxID=1070528 RepID=A0A6C0JGJ5_9ZZZZ